MREVPYFRNVLLIVDTQNGFCHPEGILSKERPSRVKHDITETVRRIVLFRGKLKTLGISCLYLCMNKKVRGGMLRWETEIIENLTPSIEEKVCWRDEPLEDPFNKWCGLIRALQETVGENKPHLLLCGFWADECVLQVGIKALKRGIHSTIITDCVYPLFDTDLKKETIEGMKKIYPNLNPSLISFESQEQVIEKISCRNEKPA